MTLLNIQCECGANQDSKAVDCCDLCIIKIYFNNPNASTLDEYLNGQ